MTLFFLRAKSKVNHYDGPVHTWRLQNNKQAYNIVILLKNNIIFSFNDNRSNIFEKYKNVFQLAIHDYIHFT